MKWFYNMKISVKLLAGFIIVALIAAIVGVVGIVNINSINEMDTELYQNNTLGIEYAGKISVAYLRIRANALKMMVVDETAKRAELQDRVEGYIIEGNTNLDLYEEAIADDTDRVNFNNVKTLYNKYVSLIQEVMKHLNAGQYDDAKAIILGDADAVGDDMREMIDVMLEYNSDAGKARADANEALANTASITMIIVIAAGLVLAIIMGVFIANAISKPVRKMVDAAEVLAMGDINANVDIYTKDEIGNLAASFRKMIDTIRDQAKAAQSIAEGDLSIDVDIKSENDLLGKKLAEMVERNNEVLGNIAVAADQVASGAKQVSDSSMTLSQGATEQASSIEELTASLEEISAQTKLNAQNADEANKLAETARKDADQGATQMKEMLKAMEEINESSANISKIIKVIDDIAFQTNILALNAAVEAARAGQHGKGFAVVAEEVRNLAARSANAAKETTEMISGSMKKVEYGTKIANETDVALKKIAESVAKAAALVSNIAVASNEQASGIAQVNQGIMQVSSVVQTTSATSQESAAASEELSSQAALLKETVSKFKLKRMAHSQNRLSDLNPELLKMLEDMSDKKRKHRI